MPPARPRFTVRRLMAIVMAVAAVMWAASLWPRAARYRAAARHHALMAKASVIAVVDASGPADRAELDRLTRLWVAHHAALKRKYESAASRPWTSPAPDPPEPFPLSGPGRRVDLNFGE